LLRETYIDFIDPLYFADNLVDKQDTGFAVHSLDMQFMSSKIHTKMIQNKSLTHITSLEFDMFESQTIRHDTHATHRHRKTRKDRIEEERIEEPSS